MGQKKPPAQTSLSKNQGIYWFAYKRRIELESCFVPTWMQVCVQTVMSVHTRILLSYVWLPLRWMLATSSFLGIFYQLSTLNGKRHPSIVVVEVLALVTCVSESISMVWVRKGVRRLGAIVFQLARTGSYAQKGLGVYVGVSHPTLTTQRLREVSFSKGKLRHSY